MTERPCDSMEGMSSVESVVNSENPCFNAPTSDLGVNTVRFPLSSNNNNKNRVAPLHEMTADGSLVQCGCGGWLSVEYL